MRDKTSDQLDRQEKHFHTEKKSRPSGGFRWRVGP